MSKKKKQNLQKLIAKKQQLQRIAQGTSLTFSEKTEVEPFQKPVTAEIAPVRPSVNAILPVEKTQPKITADRALRHTAGSIVIIAILLIAAVIFDQKSPYLNQFGDWIYSALRLQS